MSKRQVYPCDALREYHACCGRLHQKQAIASDAEQLMRSRYSAFVLGHWDYVHATWHSSTRPPRETLVSDSKVKWLSLTVIAQQTSGDEAFVEFIAHYKYSGRAAQLHERSRFVREGGSWFYLDGEIFD